MNKQDFLAQLRKELSGLPKEDAEERLTFYSEMLDDRIEEGLSEEEAVSAVGSVDEIVAQTIADIPLAKIARERLKPNRRLKVYEIVLLALGSPLWLSLGIAAAAVLLALYVSLWSVLVALWTIGGALAVCAVGSVPTCIVFVAGGSSASGAALLSAGMVCAGLAIFMVYGCKTATKGTILWTKRMALWSKNRFIKKEEV